jgi:hypothetical protein
MSCRFFTAGGVLGVVVVVVTLGLVPADAQTPSTAAKRGVTTPLPRTPWGDPDLQGIWNNGTVTPLERPSELAGKQVFTDEEASAFTKQARERANADRRDGSPRADIDRAYNEFWFDRGTTVDTRRTSLIVDPINGRIPALTPEGQAREAARADRRRRRGPSDSWEDRSLTERCILNHGVPPLPTGYNNNYQILQTPGYVVILYEMLYEPRIIPLDGRRHVGRDIKLWRGDSRGRWDGNTLVVETTNFSDKVMIRGINIDPTEALHITERFTRVNANTIDYQFTIEDPNTWTRPFTGSVPMTRTDELMYEYACHEGNYGMFGILAGARAEERAADERARKKP